MHKSDIKSKLIEILSETPFVGYACKKVGIARATFYRWMKDNLKFRKEVENAIKGSRENTNEIVESVLVKKARDGDMKAISLYLQNNHPRYIPKRTIYVDPPKIETKELKPYEKCEKCGNAPLPPELTKQITKAFENAKSDKYLNDKD